MAFDFPSNPLIGDIHTEAGVEYQYAGDSVWSLAGGGDLTEYVLKAGDTMTGGLRVKPDGVGGVRMSPGDAGRAGMFEFYDAADVRMGYIGWGNTEFIRLYTEPGKKWDVQGRGFLMNEGAGIHWGSTPAQTDPYNFSEGICLYGYGGTSQFGFTITSGTLNYIVQNAGNQHCFRVGDEVIMTVKNDHVRIPGAGLRVEGGDLNVSLSAFITGNLDVVGAAKIPKTTNKMIQNPVAAGGNGYFIGDSWHGMCFDGATVMEFIEYHGIWKFIKRTTGTTGGTVIYTIDNVGSVGNSVNVTASEALATARGLGVEPDEERGVDVMKVMAALLAKVNRLEAELATLKGGPTVEVKTVNVTPPPRPKRR